jgi:membrane-associated protease RseP (regulator of RpoE activity)
MRWWMPLLALLGGTAALVFAAWLGGVDMHAAAQRLADRMEETFHRSSWEWNDERGDLRIEFDTLERVKRATFDGRPLPLEDVVLEDGYLTVTSLHYDDGELKYWRIPLDREDELREEVSNPRWPRTLMRIHPCADGEPPGLRIARLGKGGAAAKAGLLVGDVITGVAGEGRATSAELEAALQHALAERAPGGPLPIAVDRGGERLEFVIELEPLVSHEQWDALPIEDPVERYIVCQEPWRRHEYERSVSAQQDARPGEAPAEPVEPLPPSEPPPPGDPP